MSNVKNNKKNTMVQEAQNEQNEQAVTTRAQETTANVVVLDPKVQLERYADVLRGCASNIRFNYVTIGTYLIKIKEEKLIVTTDGWQKFITDTLDMSVPTAYRIMSTVEKFYNPKSLETDPEVIAKLEGFKDSTISRLLPLGDYETIKGAIIDGTFTAEMSARDVTAKVSEIIGKKRKTKKASVEELQENTTEEEPHKKEEKRDNPTTGEPTNYDSEVYAFINDMINATSLVEVQNRAKAFRERWFK